MPSHHFVLIPKYPSVFVGYSSSFLRFRHGDNDPYHAKLLVVPVTAGPFKPHWVSLVPGDSSRYRLVSTLASRRT